MVAKKSGGSSRSILRQFNVGQILATPNAEDQLPYEVMFKALRRHTSCDWGDVCEEDRQANENALIEGLRLFSVYHTPEGTSFWIITEADRSATTILMPDDCASCHDAVDSFFRKEE